MKAPVVATLAAAEPETLPNIALAMVATFAPPPVVRPPPMTRARSMKVCPPARAQEDRAENHEYGDHGCGNAGDHAEQAPGRHVQDFRDEPQFEPAMGDRIGQMRAGEGVDEAGDPERRDRHADHASAAFQHQSGGDDRHDEIRLGHAEGEAHHPVIAEDENARSRRPCR